ncbi:MAG: aspartate-semialdehyde dehydrogenase [Bacteroidales bacterium]|nr:aspartate-semialdehyde dehydrogenase [Bacteroidales bacterium]
MKLLIAGATGLVGSKMLAVIAEEGVQIDELIVAASERSVGKEIDFNGNLYKVVSMQNALDSKPDVVLFSAGGEASKEWAPKFAKNGSYVIDNSSAWRMEDNVPLVVPEVNAEEITSETKIIANPNCSTIQLVVALKPLQHIYGIKRLVISTYQSVTGSGMAGISQMEDERGMKDPLTKAYPHRIDKNVIPHGGSFLPNDYTTEEMKLVNETRKILSNPNIAITATVVRVPVTGGHSESVNIEFEREYDINEAKKLIGMMPGIVVLDFPMANLYPMPSMVENRNQVFVGRIRRDESIENGLNMWIVADNLRKGAATNAVQILQYLVRKKLI